MLEALRRAFRDPGVPPRLRFMSRGFVRWPATILAVILVGTVTFGQISRLSAKHFERGTARFGPDALASPGSQASPLPAPSGSPGRKGGKGPKGTPTPTASTSPSPGGDGFGEFAWDPPAEGTYGYALSGHEDVNLTGPACSRDYREGRITVAKLSSGYQLDTEYVNADGSITHRERRLIVYDDAGVHISYTEASVFCVVQRNAPADYTPPLLLFQFPLTVGAVWTSHSVSQNRTTDLTGQVLRTESVTAAGQTFHTYVVKTLATFSGDQKGERSDTWWFDPLLGMPVRWEESTDAKQGPATFKQHATWVLTSLP